VLRLYKLVQTAASGWWRRTALKLFRPRVRGPYVPPYVTRQGDSHHIQDSNVEVSCSAFITLSRAPVPYFASLSSFI
jgi:hypothetical protein